MTKIVPRARGRAPACALVLAAALATHTSDAAARGRFGDRPLHLRSRGHDVRVLQSWLTRLGQPTGVDGVFGPGTRRSLRRWEQSRGRARNGRLSRSDARAMRQLIEHPATAVEVPGTGRARLGPDGRAAAAPPDAPPPVVAAIAAANEITDKPYRYGGGHGRFHDSGYDCSGSVSYVLHGAGLLGVSRDSTGFMRWQRPGPGRWITVYANGGHAYMVVAGLRFDTSGRGEDGPRWRPLARSGRRFTIRHPEGL